MAKAKKLPSGQWRVQAYSHTDENGKQHRVSFTAATKAEAEMKAAEYAATKHRVTRHDLTVAEAIDGYIKAKENVLSPSTIRSYREMQSNYYANINNRRLSSLSSAEMQTFVSHLAGKYSPKSVRNIYGLLTAALALYCPDMVFRVTMPAKEYKRAVSPSDEEVKALFANANEKLRICIALAICGLRRGEICALKHEDIHDGVAEIHADIVRGPDHKWIYKPTAKTAGSNRSVLLPEDVLELIGEGEGFIVGYKNPNEITNNFSRLRERLGLSIRFHDLRHYYASVGAVLGIPDVYLADMGGWRHDSEVMKRVYQNRIMSMSDHYARKMNGHISEIIKADA